MRSLDFSEIKNRIITLQQLLEVEKGIATILNEVFKLEKNFDSVLKENMPTSVAQAISKLIYTNKIDIQDKIEAKNFMQACLDECKRIPKVRITFAKEPTYRLLQRISGWLEENLGEHMLIDVAYEKKIIAGIIIEYKGTIKDYSLRAKFLEKLKNIIGDVAQALTDKETKDKKENYQRINLKSIAAKFNYTPISSAGERT